MPNLYRNESSDPKSNAQRNLCDRTHYVDDDTLRSHKSRVISAQHTDGGLLFAIVTSDALDPDNRRRGFRYVIFDLFGHVLSRCALEQASRTSEQATKAMWTEVNAMNAAAITQAGMVREQNHHADEMRRVAANIVRLADEGKLRKVAA